MRGKTNVIKNSISSLSRFACCGKKGISAIVATVLIILITVAAIAIIWVAILPMIGEIDSFGDKDVRLEIVTDGGYTFCDVSSGILSVQVQRGADESDLVNFIFLVIIKGNSVSYSTDENGADWVVPGPNEAAVYRLNVSKFIFGACDSIDSVSVIPVFSDGEQGSPVSSPRGGIRIGSSPDGGAGSPDVSGCTVTGAEICIGGVDEDCDGDVDWDDSDCDVGYFTGSGIVGDPYMIYNCYQLQNMSYNLSAYYKLGRDVDCLMTSGWDGGSGFDPVGDSSDRFTGSLDGKDFEISGLFINRTDNSDNGRDIGLFGYVDGGAISNVGMVDSDIRGYSRVGGITGVTLSTTITNSYNTGSVVGGGDYVGGITGASAAVITNSYNTGSVMGGRNYVGGVVGYATSSSTITNSYNSGSINGSTQVGGIVGTSSSSTITNSYNSGVVLGLSFYGGIVGIHSFYSGGIISSSFYLISACAGCNSVGTDLTDIEMKTEGNYTGWDFDDVWDINEGSSYPWLR